MVMEWLKSRFQNQTISIRKLFPWPARSPDLSPLELFLWGDVKDVAFRARPTNITDIKTKIRAAIRAIPGGILTRVISNFDYRLYLCIAPSGIIVEINVSI